MASAPTSLPTTTAQGPDTSNLSAPSTKPLRLKLHVSHLFSPETAPNVSFEYGINDPGPSLLSRATKTRLTSFGLAFATSCGSIEPKRPWVREKVAGESERDYANAQSAAAAILRQWIRASFKLTMEKNGISEEELRRDSILDFSVYVDGTIERFNMFGYD